jgi:hypothetical protein
LGADSEIAFDPFSLGVLCSEGVTRAGQFEPCDKAAVAARIDPTEGTPYAVCGYHSRAVMVPLAELLAAARGGSR